MKQLSTPLLTHINNLPYVYYGRPTGVASAKKVADDPIVRQLMERELDEGLSRLNFVWAVPKNKWGSYDSWLMVNPPQRGTDLWHEIEDTIRVVKIYEQLLKNFEYYDKQTRTDFFGHEYGVGDTVLYPKGVGQSIEFGVGIVTKFHANGAVQIRPAKQVDGPNNWVASKSPLMALHKGVVVRINDLLKQVP